MTTNASSNAGAARAGASLRTKFLGIVLAGAVLPLALVGLWLASSAVRSGEELLRSQLAQSLSRQAADVELAWTHRRSDVELLAGNEPVRLALAAAGGDTAPSYLLRAFETMPSLQWVIVRDRSGQTRWVLGDRSAVGGAANGSGTPIVDRSPTVSVKAAIRGDSVEPLGDVEAGVRVSALVPGGDDALGDGPVLAVRDHQRGVWLVTRTLPPESLQDDRFVVNDRTWVAVRRTLEQPPLELVAAAPLDPVTGPFARNARIGIIALAFAAVVVVLVTVGATLRLTHSLGRLAVAADAVAHGDFDQRVEDGSSDEVGRVARAFNTMTESVRRMLRERSQREALAAMGDLAAVLAHQVRSPLTSMRLDLQRVESKLAADGQRDLVTRAISQLDRLERAVTGVLRVAKGGASSFATIDTREPLRRAVSGVEHEFHTAGAELRVDLSSERLAVRGDATTLEQLFTNVLLNAAHALTPSAHAHVRAHRENGQVVVTVEDTGRGMDDATLQRIFEPYYTTKPDGLGIGLAVSQRIVNAHEGSIDVTSQPGRGTRVRMAFAATSD